MNKKIHLLEKYFERFLWESRFVVISAVLSSLLAAMAMFFVATADAVFMIGHLGDYISTSISDEQRNVLRGSTVTHIVEIVDGYLLATVLLIFALGLYELFISPIDVIKNKGDDAKTASNVLIINSLDDLKARLAKVILMILIVRFFEHAISMKFDTPLDLLMMAGGIALIGLALFLSHEGDKAQKGAANSGSTKEHAPH